MARSNPDAKISTCNLSDAMNRGGSLGDFRLVGKVERMISGPAVTCRTQDGDWKAVVKAIESAGRGDVIVVESVGGKSKAVVGGLLASLAKKRGAAAFVIDGGVRDIADIRALNIPVYARTMVPHAGDPLGKGRVGVQLTINGVKIRQGDTVACDGSGVVAIPRSKKDEVFSRAREIVAKEENISRGIKAGKSISEMLGF